MVPKVSVVTVTFNCQDVIESTVRSVVNQDYGNVEYIVVDGGSKDDTLDILNRYRSRFAYFISEKDNGIFDAMNKAIIASTGDWILFLNAGDILASANVLSGIFSKPYGGRVGVVFGDVYFKRATGISLWKGKRKLLSAINPQYIVLKPSLHGGICGGNEWIAEAEKRHIGWWITSALESNIGLNAIAQWCATFDNPLPQGLGTGLLFTDNVEMPLEVRKDCLWFCNDDI